MNDSIFRRDTGAGSVSLAAQLALRASDASRAFVPEPPASPPLGPPAHVPSPQAGRGEGDSSSAYPMSAIGYAQYLIDLYGQDRAVGIIGAEARALREAGR